MENITGKSRQALRFTVAFLIVATFGLGLRWMLPTRFFDCLDFDYNATSASHAILSIERAAGTPNDGNLNINSHPGIPYYAFMSLSARLTELFIDNENSPPQSATEETPTARIIRFFNNIEVFWNIQGILAPLIAAFGAGLLAVYCAEAPLLMVLALFACPLAYMDYGYCNSYIYDTLNETFALPVACLFLLTTQRICSGEGDRTKEPFLFMALGFVAGLAYSIKLPYISFFFAGMFCIPAACGLSGLRSSGAARRLVCYLAGFALFMAVTACVLGPETIKNWLRYHYNVLTHAGFAGGGEHAVITGETFFTNFSQAMDFLRRLWTPVLLLMGLFAALAATKKLTLPRGRQCLLLALLIILNFLAVVKHWSAHYALILAIYLPFLLYEAILPFIRSQGQKKRLALTAILCISVLTMNAKALSGFSDTVHDKQASREQKQDFMRKIEALPLEEGEAVYFQWGTHILPIFAVNHPLSLTYLRDKSISYAVMRHFFPSTKLQTNVTYRFENKYRIRYIVDCGREIAWDMPYPGFQAGSNTVLEWKHYRVMEQEHPVSAAEINSRSVDDK
jgi:hypothetical protein